MFGKKGKSDIPKGKRIAKTTKGQWSPVTPQPDFRNDEEVYMTADEYKRFVRGGGKAKSAVAADSVDFRKHGGTHSVHGGYYVTRPRYGKR